MSDQNDRNEADATTGRDNSESTPAKEKPREPDAGPLHTEGGSDRPNSSSEPE
jgi:hypothetical protein